MTGNNQKQPIRVLHIVGGMNTGGVETWLMHVLRQIDRDRYRFDFLVHTTKPCFYDEEIKQLGCRIIPCLQPKRPWQYIRNFRRILKENGPYDAVHSHVHHFSGFTLLLARIAGVPIRIAHSHNDTSLKDGGAGVLRKLYLKVTEWLIRSHATAGLACSGLAAVALFGKNWEHDPRWLILYYGIDLEPFMEPVNRTEVRKEFGIPKDAFVLGHVGRFAEQKNHDFLLDIFAEVSRRDPSAYLLLVGDGPLKENIRQKAQRLGLTDKVIFAGVRPDIPRLMLGAMDVFVFPSHYEGLGIVLIEAQAAGLPCVISDLIAKEATINPSLITPLTLKHTDIWADIIIAKARNNIMVNCPWKEIERSKFSIFNCLDSLCKNYDKLMANL